MFKRESKTGLQGASRQIATIVAVLVLASVSIRAHGQSDPGVITEAGKVHELRRGFGSDMRLHLTGTITYYDPADGIMFLQDATGGVYVNTDKDYAVRNGDLVTLDGRASPSYRTEVANNPVIHVLGRGVRFAAPNSSYVDLVAGRGDCRLVTIRGMVRAADLEQHQGVPQPSAHMDVVMPDGEVQVYLHPSIRASVESLRGTEVQLTGVAGGLFDAKDQMTGIMLYIPEAGDLKILKKPAVSGRELPLTPIDEVFQSFQATDLSKPVRVRGTITYYKRGESAVLERGGKSISVETRGTTNLEVGDQADAIGYATNREYAPSLRQAALIRVGGREEITPRPISYADAASGRYSDNLVSLEGKLVSQLHDGNAYTVVIDVGGHLVTGHLEQSEAAGDPGNNSIRDSVRNYDAGSRVRIAGICRIMPGGAWRSPYLSHLEMRRGEDLVLISQPSWFSEKHLFELLGGLVLVALAIAVWAALLRRRVVSQTAWIDRSVTIARERSRILERISSNESLEELLKEICDSVTNLLPGTRSACFVKPGAWHKELGGADLPVDGEQTRVLYEVPLRDGESQVIGKVLLLATEDYVPAADSAEIYEMLAELSALAMRQALLYQGLVHHSTHDMLTELPNRRLCESTLMSELRRAEADSSQLSVIYIDIDHFKMVNDRFGHKTGDLYLQEISSRLRQQIRSVDMLARIGGDEFVVIAPFPSGHDRAPTLVARLEACFSEPFNLGGKVVEGSVSLGFANYPEHGATAEELTRHADHSMYIAKRRHLHTAEETKGTPILTTDDLEVALLRDRFRLWYQPQFSAAGKLTCLEALIRLDDPALGLVTPDAFISVAEQHPVIVGIGAWVLRTAIRDASLWKLDKGEPVSIAVNVSARQIEEPGYADSVLACLREFNFPADRLELELIERTFMFGKDVVSQQLYKLRAAGVRIALDDFGTGHSCLSVLHRLPIDTIKLDRSFIRAMDNEPGVLPVVEAIVSMAHALGKRVVAEAVEHVGPVPTLLRMGQMDFQGYLLSRPVPSKDIDSKIAPWREGIPMPVAFHQPQRTLHRIS